MSAPPLQPTVSVIMAAYNGAPLIGETLASLAAQTFGDFEVIVIDDCSTDDTVAVARAFRDPRIRVIAKDVNEGPVRTRNRAFAEAQGRYIAACDQDDLSHPDRFARQVAHLDAHPETVLLGAAALALRSGVTTPLDQAPHTSPGLIAWLLRIENPIVWSSVMLRAEAARRLDPFTRPDILYAEDFDLYHRIGALGRIERIDEPLLTYRVHEGGASKRFTETMEASAGRVLAGCYAPLFGDASTAAAALVVRHLMLRRPVPDRATLTRLGAVLVELQADFLASHTLDPETRKLIRWETAKRWRRIHRAGLRSGTLTLGDAVAVRPDHMGLGHASLDDLILSRLVGSARATRRRRARP